MGIEVEGHRIEWGDLDLGKCKLTHFGLNKRSSPFFAKRFPGLSLPVSEQEVTWREAWDLGYAPSRRCRRFNRSPRTQSPSRGAGASRAA